MHVEEEIGLAAWNTILTLWRPKRHPWGIGSGSGGTCWDSNGQRETANPLLSNPSGGVLSALISPNYVPSCSQELAGARQGSRGTVKGKHKPRKKRS